MAASIATRSASFADGISAEQEQDANSALTELDKGYEIWYDLTDCAPLLYL